MFIQTFRDIRYFPTPFWIIIISSIINQVGNMAFVFLMLYLNIYLKFSLMEASIGLAVNSLGIILGGLLGGPLADRFKASRVMIFALLANSLMLFIFFFLQNYSAILIVCVLWGFVFGLYKPATQTLVSFIIPVSLHKIGFSILRLAINLGMSVGPAMGGYLAMHSFSSIFIINAVMNVAAAVILILGFKHITYSSELIQGTKRHIDIGFRWLKKDVVLRLFVFGFIPVSMVFFQHESTLSLFLKNQLHFSLGFYGLLFTINTLIIVFFELPLNIATLHWSARRSLMIGSFFITAGFAGLYFASTQAHVIMLTILWTIGEMVLFPAATAYAAEIAPIENRGSYISLYNTSFNMGIFLGPLLGGLVMSYTSADVLWVVCGIWGLISVVTFSLLPSRR